MGIMPFKNVLFLMLIIHRWTFGEEYGVCTNFIDQRGVCRHIRKCEPLLRLFRAYGNNSSDFIRRSRCPLQGPELIVCCPNTQINNNIADKKKYVLNSVDPAVSRTNMYGPLYPPVCGTSTFINSKIVNGEPAELGSWPWAALLLYRLTNSNKSSYLCGGSLISARHVLTAGHCVHNRKDLYVVRLGELDTENDNEGATPTDFFIEKRFVHPKYDPVVYTNDIALLRLSHDIRFTDLIKPICLPVADDIQQEDLSQAFPYTVGWGTVEWNGPTPSILQLFQSRVINQEKCKSVYADEGAVIDDRVLCGSYAFKRAGVCQGDSGGPMMLLVGNAWYSIGIVSFGNECEIEDFPSVYTKTQAFLDFILANLH